MVCGPLAGDPDSIQCDCYYKDKSSSGWKDNHDVAFSMSGACGTRAFDGSTHAPYPCSCEVEAVDGPPPILTMQVQIGGYEVVQAMQPAQNSMILKKLPGSAQAITNGYPINPTSPFGNVVINTDVQPYSDDIGCPHASCQWYYASCERPSIEDETGLDGGQDNHNAR